MTILSMPRLGETVTEGVVVKWLKNEGERVGRDEMVVQISTDKVDTEIPAPAAGVLAKILVAPGEKVAVGTPLVEIGEEERAARPAPAAVEGETGAAISAPAAFKEEPPPRAKKQLVSPIVRKLARENRVDPAQISGSGREARVTKQDVLDHIDAKARQARAAAGPDRAEIQRRGPSADRQEIVPLSHTRKMIAEHMVRSVRTSAHVTVVLEVDLENLVQVRRARKKGFSEKEGFSLTYLPFICRATVEALGRWPTFNAEVDGDRLIIKKFVNLGIAVSIPDGLIVPVIKGADELNTIGLARALNDLAVRAREGRLRPDEVHEGTFTITNPGSFGTFIQTPIINQPQVAILSLEAIEPRVVAIDGAIAVRHRANFSLSYDHRVNDGAAAAQFLSEIKTLVETGALLDEFSAA